jgi:mercuric reductase
MNDKLEKALTRLNSILPLKRSQDSCAPQVRELHRQMLQSYVASGRVPSTQEMARWVSDVPGALDRLRDLDLVTFGADGAATGAYPFTMEEREHKVEINGHRVHAMCALDALAIGPMFDAATAITSRCALTGSPVRIRMAATKVLNLAEVRDLQLGIAWAAADAELSCAHSLCLQMVFLRDSATARQWLDADPEGREVFALPQAVQFARRFFAPLLS